MEVTDVTGDAGVKETQEESKETDGNLFKDILNIRHNELNNNKIFKNTIMITAPPKISIKSLIMFDILFDFNFYTFSN